MTALATLDVAAQEEKDDPSRQAGFQQSWYPVALARELGPNNVLGVDFLGTRVVLYRDGQGKAMVQSAYCAHLGADLSIGDVVDGQIRCAFHNWRYGADGRCKHIPTGDKIPPGARIFTYPSAEAWGFIWAFNGETPLFDLPRMHNVDEDDLVFEAHRRGFRPVDYWIATANAIDFQHLRSLHHLPAVDPEVLASNQYGFEYEVDAPGFFIQHGRITGTGNFTLHGRLDGNEMFGGFFGSPIAHGKSMAYFGIGMRRSVAEKLGGDAAVQERLDSFRAFIDGLAVQDNPIFETMRFRKGTLVASDRYLSRFFKYISEFPRFQSPYA